MAVALPETLGGREVRYVAEVKRTLRPATLGAAIHQVRADFRRRFWAFAGEDPQLVPTLLVYADLLAIGDARCLETAQLLRGPLLDRLI